MRTIAGWYRWVFGLLALAAVVWGFRLSVVQNGSSWVSYFSFFTILSNIAAIAVFLAGAWPWLGSPRAWAARPWAVRPWFGFVRGAVTVYMTITGIVYALLLSGLPFSGPAWINDVEHRVMPAVVVLDWLLMPPSRRIGLRRAMAWLVIPVIYLTYSEVRGPFAHWYPYPFLDPRPHGVIHVVVYSIGVAVAFVAVTAAVAVIGDFLSSRNSDRLCSYREQREGPGPAAQADAARCPAARGPAG
jgi:hypothetical protein